MEYFENNKKQTKVIRIELGRYNYLKEASKFNKRTISGQLYWICEIVEYLEKSKPALYANIAYQVNQTKNRSSNFNLDKNGENN